MFTVEPPFNLQNDLVYAPVDNKISRSDTSIPAVWCMSVMVGMTELIFCQPWGEGERPVLLRCLAVSADASSNQMCRRTLFIHKTVCCLYGEIGHFLCSVSVSNGTSNKQTYMKTETCKLYSRDFWIFPPNIIKIDPYNLELYLFKVGPLFWDTVYICSPWISRNIIG